MTEEEKPLSERILDYCREDDPLLLEVKSLESEVARLTAELGIWKEKHRIRTMASDNWSKRAEEAEARVAETKKLAEEWREEAKQYTIHVPRRIMLEECADELEKALK